jgi:hypothetical protein
MDRRNDPFRRLCSLKPPVPEKVANSPQKG